MAIRVSHEGKRGCGYRKPGGLYVVAGQPNAPCGKLPIEMHVCGTCGGGIKPTRAWQWIRPRLLFSEAECRLGAVFGGTNAHVRDQCGGCPVGSAMPERAGLLWVGGSFYPTAEDFMREARVQGVSRRIPTVPKGFMPGETVIYLAHREVQFAPKPCGEHRQAYGDADIAQLDCKACRGLRPAVFSAFVPRAIEYVVRGDEEQEVLDRLEKRGIELVKVVNPQGELFDGANDQTDEEVEVEEGDAAR